MGHINSVSPGPTVNIILQPAHRTWQPTTLPSLEAAAAAAAEGGGGGAIGRGGNEGCPMFFNEQERGRENNELDSTLLQIACDLKN